MCPQSSLVPCKSFVFLAAGSLASRAKERSFRAQISPSSNEAAENELKKELR